MKNQQKNTAQFQQEPKQHSMEQQQQSHALIQSKRQYHYQSFKSAERDGMKKIGVGGMKNYLKHNKNNNNQQNQNGIPSPRSEFSGGAMSNFSSTSELKCKVNASIKMKTPNQTCGPPNMQLDHSGIIDSAQKFEHFSNTQQSVLLSPSMNYKTVGGKTPQNRQPSQIVNVSGGRTPGATQDNHQFRKFNNPSSQGNSVTSPTRYVTGGNNIQRDNQNNMMYFGQTQSISHTSTAQGKQQYTSSNIHNTSKHESSMNMSSKILSNELKGSIREDEPRDSWTHLDRQGNLATGLHFGNRKTVGMPSYLQQKAAKIKGMAGTPKISLNIPKNEIMRHQKQNIILDSDNDMDGANMDDTDEHESINNYNKFTQLQVCGQDRKSKKDPKMNTYHSVQQMVQVPEEDDCDVADEDIGINSLSCERQTVNSQGVLSMKDFQSLSKRNIFQRKLNKSQQAQRGIRQNPIQGEPGMNATNGRSCEQNQSPFKGENFLNDANGPVIGHPSNYAENRMKRHKEQQRSLFISNNDLYVNKQFDPSTQIDSSSHDQQSKGKTRVKHYDPMISNSSQKPDQSNNNINFYGNQQFANTYDNKNNPITKYLGNLSPDLMSKSRQSTQKLTTFNSANSNQITNSQSIKLLDEQATTQNFNNQSAQKAKPSFRPSKFGQDIIQPFDYERESKLGQKNSESHSQSHRGQQMQAHIQLHNLKPEGRVSDLQQQNSTNNLRVPSKSPTSNNSRVPMGGSLSNNNPNMIQRTKKTKAGIVSPQCINPQMLCTCDPIDRLKNMSKEKSRQQAGHHQRQASRTKDNINQQIVLTSQTDEDYNVSLTQSVSEIDKLDSARNPRICGNYCKNMTSEQEKNIILQCLKESITKHFENLQGKAIEEFKSSIVSEVETAKYTAQYFQSMNMINVNENDKRYIISASWWREWCDYTNFDLSQLQLKSSSQIHHGSFNNKIHQVNNSEMSSIVNLSQRKKSEADQLEIQYRNQNIVMKMESKSKLQDLTQVREYTQESSFQQVQLSTQKDNEYYNTIKINTQTQNYQDRLAKQANRMESLMLQIKRSPMDSIESSLTMKYPTNNNQKSSQHQNSKKKKKNQNNQKVSVDNSVDRKSKQHFSNRYQKELSFRQGSSIMDLAENESQFSIKDSVRQRQVDFNKELQLLKQKNKDQANQNYMNNQHEVSNYYNLENEQDSININSDSLGSDRRRDRRIICTDMDRDLNSQSSAFFQNNKLTTGGYNKPSVIRNLDLLKNPAAIKELQKQQNQKGGNLSPNSNVGGRKLVGNTGNSQQIMNHVYMNLKDDLIEHFDFEAVNQQVFQFFKAWYDIDIQIMRFIKRDNVNSAELYLDLYPEKRLANNHFQQQTSGQKSNKQNNTLRSTQGKHLTPSQIDLSLKQNPPPSQNAQHHSVLNPQNVVRTSTAQTQRENQGNNRGGPQQAHSFQQQMMQHDSISPNSQKQKFRKNQTNLRK